MVSKIDANFSQESNYSSQEKQSVNKSLHNEVTSLTEKTGPNCMSSIRSIYRKQGFSKETTRIIMASWKSGTKRQYNAFITRWCQHCSRRDINSISPTLDQILEFMTTLFETGLGYSSLNTARGALSALGIKIDGTSVGAHPLVVRYMKGVFNLRPTKPRYSGTWDVSMVLRFLQTWSSVKLMSLKQLTLKLTMLIALTNAARVQSIHQIHVHNMKKCFNEYVFEYSGLLKQCRPGYKMPVVRMKAHPPNRRLCIYFVVKEYLARTESLRNGEEALLLSYVNLTKK